MTFTFDLVVEDFFVDLADQRLNVVGARWNDVYKGQGLSSAHRGGRRTQPEPENSRRCLYNEAMAAKITVESSSYSSRSTESV